MSPKRERTPFGERLFLARTHAKLTQAQLSKAAGISQGTLGELEWIGDGSSATVRLAMACGVRPTWLAEGEGDMLESGSMSKEVRDLASAVEKLPPAQREWVLVMLREAVKLGTEMAATEHTVTGKDSVHQPSDSAAPPKRSKAA